MAPGANVENHVPLKQGCSVGLASMDRISWEKLQLDSIGTVRQGRKDCWGRWEGEKGTKKLWSGKERVLLTQITYKEG